MPRRTTQWPLAAVAIFIDAIAAAMAAMMAADRRDRTVG